VRPRRPKGFRRARNDPKRRGDEFSRPVKIRKIRVRWRARPPSPDRRAVVVTMVFGRRFVIFQQFNLSPQRYGVIL